MAFKHLVNSLRYKLVTSNMEEENVVRNAFESPFKISFDKRSVIYKKMGALKGPEILKK